MQGLTLEAGPTLNWWALLSTSTIDTRLWLMFAGDLQVHGPAAETHAPAPLAAFAERYAVAEMYQAYALIHKAAHEPFHSIFGATLFNAARFLLMRLLQVSPGANFAQQPAAQCCALPEGVNSPHASWETCCGICTPTVSAQACDPLTGYGAPT